MRLDDKRAMTVLIAVVLWTAAPLIACVPGLGAHSTRDCCAGMNMMDCGSDSTACAPCCQLAPQPNGAMLVTASTPKRYQEVGEPGWQTCLQPMSDPEFGQPRFHEAPPPDPSPGGLSVLRI